MQSLGVNGYAADEVKTRLHASGRKLRFRYEHLDEDNVQVGWLNKVQSARVANNSLADIKRTATFVIGEDSSINFLKDRIRPWMGVEMQDGGWAEWPLGIFLLSTPVRSVDPSAAMREVLAFDQLLVLKDDAIDVRYAVASGTNVITAVGDVLTAAGIMQRNLVATAETLPVAREWPPGTTRLRIINDLLASINYRSLYFNSAGVAVAEPYAAPSDRPIGYTYAADNRSVLVPQLRQELDLFSVPNKWIAVVSEPDRAPLVSTYTNTDPSSPTSTVSRGRTITRILDTQEATSQASLDAKVQRAAVESSQVYETVDFETALMPHHEDSDVIEINYALFGAKARFIEHSWEMTLRVGSKMKHVVRRVVSV